jgi:TPR repeat protein
MNRTILVFFLISAGLLLPSEQVIAEVSDYKKAVNAYNRGDYEASHKLMRSLAHNGFAKAQYSLGVMYESGKGVNASLKKAKKWFQLAAEKGISKAQYKLGLVYLNGRGVEKDYSKAIKWWKLAAKKGNAKAQTYLGMMFENGQGVPQDYNKAIKLYRQAVSAGYTTVQEKLNLLLKKKVEAQVNLGLGVKFENGQGVIQDYSEAIRWYRLAADLGFSEGEKKIDLLLSKMKKTKETPTGDRHLINLEEKKPTELKICAQLNLPCAPGESQMKPGEINEADTASLANTKIQQEQIENTEYSHPGLNAGGISISIDEFDADRYRQDEIAKADDSINLKINALKHECSLLNGIIEKQECVNQFPKELVKNKNDSILNEKNIPSSKKVKRTLNPTQNNIFSKDVFIVYLKKWVRAWESQDPESYFSFYAKNFMGLQNRHLDWRISRRVALKKHTNISIKLDNIQISQNKDVVKTNFTQTFKSDQYSDIVKKELFWVKYGAEWKITEETWLLNS